MYSSEQVQAVFERHDLAACDVYFVDLIPLIDVLWADSANQPEELSLLYRFALDHMVRFPDTVAVSVDDVNRFLDRFAHERPPAELLDDLRALAIAHIQQDAATTHRRKVRIIDYCLEIAAACVPPGTDGYQRIMAEERSRLVNLMQAFAVPPERPVSLS